MSECRLIEYLTNIKCDKNFNTLPTYLRIRVVDAIKQLNSPFFIERTIQSPTYLNDLGVRKSKSPMMAYKILLETCPVGTFPFGDLSHDLKSLDINWLGSYLDSYVLITGNYDLAYQALKSSNIPIAKITDYTTLINIGSTFAAVLDSQALNYFSAAYSVTSNPENKVVALHRQAAYLVKREHNKSKSLQKLHELVQQISNIPEGWKRQIFMALADNLFALQIVKAGLTENNVATIIYLLKNAETLVDSLTDFKTFNKTEPLTEQAQRYRSQIEMNYAQILIGNHQLTAAINVLSNNLTHVSSNAPDYLCEAFATLGYALYLNHDFPSAISNLKSGLSEYMAQGALNEANQDKRILIAASYKNGDIEYASKLFNTLRNQEAL